MKRGAPLKRTGFNRTGKQPLQVARAPRPALVPLTRRVVYGAPANEAVFAQPKEEVKAKPGKGTPNAEERAWMDWIVSHGCVACRKDGHSHTPPAVHHILRGGQRIGHLFTLPLCDPGHHQQGQARGMVSRHPWKARFEQMYGTELELLAELRLDFAGRGTTKNS